MCNEQLLTFLPADSYACHLDNHKDGILSFHSFIFYIVRLLTRYDTLVLLPDYTYSVKRNSSDIMVLVRDGGPIQLDLSP